MPNEKWTDTKTVAWTRGPWQTGTNGDKCAKNHAICSGATVIAKVYGEGYPAGEGWGPRSQADANLIAAAPELVEALEYCDTAIGAALNIPISDGTTALLINAREKLVAALRKARGER